MIIAGVLVFCLVGGLVLVTMKGRRREQLLASGLAAVVVGVPFAPTLLSGKNSYDSAADAALSSSPVVLFLGYVAVALAVVIIGGRGTKADGVDRYGPFLPVLIGLSFVAVVHGEYGYLSRVVGAGLVILAMGWSAVTRAAAFFTVRAMTSAAVLGSLLAARLLPQLAFVPRENSGRDFFGLGSRLVGLAGSPNYMALIASVCFLAWLVSGSSRFRVLMLVASLGTVLWSQGRNSLLVVAAGLVLYGMCSGRRQLQTRGVLTAIVLISIAAPVLGLTLSASSPWRPILESVTTGRIDVWEISWNEFLKSPLIGAGPSFLTPEFWGAGEVQAAEQYSNSHNQWLEALSQGGLILSLCTGATIALLARRSVRHREGVLLNRALMVTAMLVFVQLAFGTPLRLAGLTWNVIPIALIVSVPQNRLASTVRTLSRRSEPSPQGLRHAA